MLASSATRTPPRSFMDGNQTTTSPHRSEPKGPERRGPGARLETHAALGPPPCPGHSPRSALPNNPAAEVGHDSRDGEHAVETGEVEYLEGAGRGPDEADGT